MKKTGTEWLMEQLYERVKMNVIDEGIDYFNENRQYNSLIILTDGFIGKKTSNTFKPMLLVLCSHGESIETVKENKWGNVIKINKE